MQLLRTTTTNCDTPPLKIPTNSRTRNWLSSKNVATTCSPLNRHKSRWIQPLPPMETSHQHPAPHLICLGSHVTLWWESITGSLPLVQNIKKGQFFLDLGFLAKLIKKSHDHLCNVQFEPNNYLNIVSRTFSFTPFLTSSVWKKFRQLWLLSKSTV